MRASIKSLLTGVILVLTLAIGGLGYVSISGSGTLAAHSGEIGRNWMPSVDASQSLKGALTNLRAGEARYLLSRTPEERAEAQQMVITRTAEVHEQASVYEGLISVDGEREIFADFGKSLENYIRLRDQALGRAAQGLTDEALDIFFNDMDADYNTAKALADRMVAINKEGAAAEVADAARVAQQTQTIVVAAIVATLVLAFGTLGFVLAGVTGPLGRLTSAMKDVSEGNLKTQIPSTSAKNEIGDMARALIVFRDNLSEAARLRAEQGEIEKRGIERARQERHDLANSFEASVGELARAFTRSSSEIADAARNLSATAEETSRQAQVVTGAADEASVNVQSVAAGAEELHASIREIASQVAHSAGIADTASSDARRTSENIGALSSAAQQIGEVVDLINEIAAQTNLLALNATIEAQRAGEAGRGFAVVALEVKQLAAQTANATSQIGGKIHQIQGAVQETVKAVTRIITTIESLRGATTTIASAVEEQGAATGEIAANTQRAATGTNDVTSNIAGVGSAAETTGAASSQLMGLSGALSEQAARLQREVGAFVQTLRAA